PHRGDCGQVALLEAHEEVVLALRGLRWHLLKRVDRGAVVHEHHLVPRQAARHVHEPRRVVAPQLERHLPRQLQEIRMTGADVDLAQAGFRVHAVAGSGSGAPSCTPRRASAPRTNSNTPGVRAARSSGWTPGGGTSPLITICATAEV